MLYNNTAVSELKVLINLTKVLERSWKSPYFLSAQRCGNHASELTELTLQDIWCAKCDLVRIELTYLTLGRFMYPI